MTAEQWHVDHTTPDFSAASLVRALDMLGGPGADDHDRREPEPEEDE